MPRPAFTVHDIRALILGALALLCLAASTRLPADNGSSPAGSAPVAIASRDLGSDSR